LLDELAHQQLNRQSLIIVGSIENAGQWHARLSGPPSHDPAGNPVGTDADEQRGESGWLPVRVQ